MKYRAIIWCGLITNTDPPRDVQEVMFGHDIDLAISAARARGVNPDDIWPLVCEPSLVPPELAAQTLPADLASLERIIKAIARDATDDDRLLFVATNHGDREGLLMETEPADEFDEDISVPAFLAPTHLAERLDVIRGQQLAVIATCYAGVFLPMAGQRRVVVAGCAADAVYHWNYHQQQPPRSPFLYELLSHWAGVSLADYEAPEARGMADAFAVIQSEHPGCAYHGNGCW